VLGTSQQTAVVVYLPTPAVAGSYTAWLYGSTHGLSAGYHIFEATQPADAQSGSAQLPCDFASEAFAEIQATYDPEIKKLYGDSYTIDMFPVGANGSDGIKPLPQDVLEGGQRIFARTRMKDCSPPDLREIDPTKTSLSIEFFQLSNGQEKPGS
jgi:hypothetical protein